MFTDTLTAPLPTRTLKQRGAGKASWKRVIDNLIASEREDMKDLATLRRRVNDPELLKLIAEMMERKTIRVMELNDLYHYGDRSRPAQNDDGAPEWMVQP